MKRGNVFLVLLLLLFPLLPVSAHGAVDVFAGAEVDSDDQSYSYLTLGSSWPMEGNYSLAAKITAAFLEYKFESDGRTLRAEVPIVTPAIGIRFKEKNYTLEGAIGLDLRETERQRPTGGPREDSDAGLALQGEVNIEGASETKFGALASYSTIDDFYWLRGRVKKGVYDYGDMRLYVGGELAGMGNDDFDSAQLGGLIELYYPDINLSFLVKGGIKNSSAAGGGAYGGVEFYYGF